MQLGLESLRINSSTSSSSPLMSTSMAEVRAIFRPRFVSAFSSACLAISKIPCVLNTNLLCNATLLPFLWLLRLRRSSLASATSQQSTIFLLCVISRTRIIRSPNCLAGDVKGPGFFNSESNNTVAFLISVPSGGELSNKAISRLADSAGV
jgi:hypothetical protein